MHRRSFFALALAGLTGALAGFRGVPSESSRYRALVQKMSDAWRYGKARWLVNQNAVRELLAMKDELGAGIQAANKSLARIRVEFDKGERAFGIFFEDVEAMTARLTKSVEALR